MAADCKQCSHTHFDHDSAYVCCLDGCPCGHEDAVLEAERRVARRLIYALCIGCENNKPVLDGSDEPGFVRQHLWAGRGPAPCTAAPAVAEARAAGIDWEESDGFHRGPRDMAHPSRPRRASGRGAGRNRAMTKTKPSDPAYPLLLDGHTSTPVIHRAGCYICEDTEYAQMGLPLCYKCFKCGGHVAADDTVCDDCETDQCPEEPTP